MRKLKMIKKPYLDVKTPVVLLVRELKKTPHYFNNLYLEVFIKLLIKIGSSETFLLDSFVKVLLTRSTLFKRVIKGTSSQDLNGLKWFNVG
jgi:hypothetical protein